MTAPIAMKLAVCAAALAVSSAAVAQGARTGTMSNTLTTSMYVGASVGRTDYDVACLGPFTCDSKSTGVKLFAGGKLNEMFGAELSYIHMGQADLGGGGDSRAHGINASLIAGFPVGQAFTVNGKIGTTYGWTRVAGPAVFGGRRDDGFGLSYGAGLSFNVSRNLDLRLDWDRYGFDFRGNDHVDMLSVGVQYRFQ